MEAVPGPSVFPSGHPGLSGDFWGPGKNAGVGCHSLHQGIFPTQGSNPGLLHCRQILYRLSYKGLFLFGTSLLFHVQF